jgi:hypothetical protein
LFADNRAFYLGYFDFLGILCVMFTFFKRKKRELEAKIETLTAWILTYERHASAIALCTGFVWDSLTLTRVDLLYENIIIASYLIIASVVIGVLTLLDARVIRKSFIVRYRVWLPVILQFAFGGLFSAFVIFYTRSGSVFASWPFLIGLAALLVGNEFFRNRYERLTFRAGVLYTALFSFAIFFVPVMIGRMGDLVFLLSGALSLFLIWLYFYGIAQLAPTFIEAHKRTLIITIGGIFILFNALYFTNSIPPIPLSLKHIGIYHSVERLPEGVYRVRYEDAPWYQFWRASSRTFHKASGGTLYCFSAVFAPTDLNTSIYHRWEYYDGRTGAWAGSGRVSFGIVGGRDGGYRGYSWKSNAQPGLWRCSVETERGALLGRTRVYVVDAPAPPELTETRR